MEERSNVLRAALTLALLSEIAGAQAPKPAVVVEFRFAAPNAPLLLVDVRVNGQGPYPFVLDTGARTCLVDSQLAAEVGIAAAATEERIGAGGPVHVGLGKATSILVGEAEVSAIEVGISDELRRISMAVGAEIRGAIGFNFLQHYRVKFDFQRRQISFLSEAQPPEAPGEGTSMPFGLAGKKPLVTVPVLVNGKGPFTFVLDTGASATVISEATATSIGVRLMDTPGRATGAGSSNIPMWIARLETLDIGNAAVPQLTVGVVGFLTALSDQIGIKIDGIVGFDYLSHFDVTLDYPRRQLVLERRKIEL